MGSAGMAIQIKGFTPAVTCCSEEGYFVECEAAASGGPCAQTSAAQARFWCFWRIGEGWLRLDSIDSWWLIEPTLVLWWIMN